MRPACAAFAPHCAAFAPRAGRNFFFIFDEKKTNFMLTHHDDDCLMRAGGCEQIHLHAARLQVSFTTLALLSRAPACIYRVKRQLQQEAAGNSHGTPVVRKCVNCEARLRTWFSLFDSLQQAATCGRWWPQDEILEAPADFWWPTSDIGHTCELTMRKSIVTEDHMRLWRLTTQQPPGRPHSTGRGRGGQTGAR
jgi:hypothetical protein